MSVVDIRSCPVCESSNYEQVYAQKFNSLAGMENADFYQKILCCYKCGMVYVGEYLSDEMLSRYYSTMSTYEYAEAGYEYPEAHRKRSENQFLFLSKFSDRYGSVIDVGCSLGYTLSLFKKTGSEVLGIEPSPKLKKIAKDNYNVDVVTGFIDHDFNLEKPYDLVILSHVAEHLKFPLDILHGVTNVLKEKGLVYIEIPSIELFDERDLFQFSFEHINYFSHGTLSNLMHQAGFEEIDHIIFENDDGTAPFYPTLGTLWLKTERTYPLINRYPHDSKVISHYVDLIKRYTGKLNERIAKIVKKYKRIAIWGAGTLTAQLLAQTPLSKANIVVIYDNDSKKDGLDMSGIPIRKPDISSNFVAADDVDTIVIGSWSSQNEIYDRIRSLEKYGVIIHRLFF